MINGKKRVVLFVAVLLVFALTRSTMAASEDVIKAANRESHLLLYGGATLQHMTLLSENFNRVYPGIKVNLQES